MKAERQSFSLDVQHFAAGVYFCRVTLESGEVVVRRVVIE
jgi:hypothetical protein